MGSPAGLAANSIRPAAIRAFIFSAASAADLSQRGAQFKVRVIFKPRDNVVQRGMLAGDPQDRGAGAQLRGKQEK